MIQDVLISKIAADATLVATFGDRVYPAYLPDQTDFPAIVYTVRLAIEHTHASAGSVEAAEVALTVYAGTYLAAWAAANILRTQLDGSSGAWGDTTIGACLLEDMSDAPMLQAENTMALAFGVRCSFNIQFQEEA